MRNTGVVKKLYAYSFSHWMLFAIAFCFFSLYHNLFFFMKQYLNASQFQIYDEQRVLLLSCLAFVIGCSMGRKYCSRTIFKLGVLLAALGLVSIGIAPTLDALMIGAVVVVAALAFSLPALFMSSFAAIKAMPAWATMAYATLISMIAAVDGLTDRMHGFYDFKVSCFALAILLTCSLVGSRLGAVDIALG